jgi:HEAT repeat protein
LQKEIAVMSRYPWKDLLTQWSEEIIESGEFEDELPSEVATSGWLGYPAATEEEIAAAEERLGTAFPPSYREFLQITNGWRMTTGFIERLRPAAEVQWFSSEDQATIDAWISASGSDAMPDEEYLVYGDEAFQPLRAEYLQTALAVSDYGDGIYLLNPQTVTPEGEWEAWFFAHWVPGADRYRSFWELMIAEHEHYLYALRSGRGEPTPRAAPSLGVDAKDLDGLLAALQKPAHRMNALQALGNLRDRRAFEPVLAILQDSRVDLFTRASAARTLGELHDPRAVQPLIDTFRQTPADLSDLQFASLLGSAAGDAGAALDDLLGSITIQDMIHALEPMLGAGMAQHLQQTLTPEAVSQGISEQLSYAARQGLLTLGDAALPALFDALHDPDPDVRGEVASLLCHVRGRPGIFERLVVAFDDPDPAVRSAVAANIEQLFDNRAVDPLLKALEDPDSTVRARAARSLGIIAFRSDTDRIIEALRKASAHDADAGVRRVASQELDRLRDRRRGH